MDAVDKGFLEHSAPIIGYHRAPLSQKFGAPRQPNLVALHSIIEMIAPYDNPAAFIGLEDFSHIWLSWQFHHNYVRKKGQYNADPAQQTDELNVDNKPVFRAQVRPPRLGGNQKIGVFASRSMYRPSNLGLSVVKLERIEIIDGHALLLISGADMIDGTPIIDIKPYVAYSDAHNNAISGFALTMPEPLVIKVSDVAHAQFKQIVNNDLLNNKAKSTLATTIDRIQQHMIAADIDCIRALIAQDPRPAYRKEELNSHFVMRYKSVDISFTQLILGELQIYSIIKV